MDINENEIFGENIKGDSNKVLSILFEAAILNKAYLEEILTMQAMIYEEINSSSISFPDIIKDSNESISARITELRATLIPKVMK